jgi:hypothetical protein
MVQFTEGTYRLVRERSRFRVEDVDRLFFACRYEGTNEGFIIEKDVFFRQIARGHIIKEDPISSIAI